MDGMTTLDDFAAAFGFDSGSENLWTTLGKVTAIDGGTFSVQLGGSETATDCDAYCSAEVGDIVLVVVSKGRARAVARKGGQLPAETYGQCFFGYLIPLSGRPDTWQLVIPHSHPDLLPTGSLIAAYCSSASTLHDKIKIGYSSATGSGGSLYVNNAETSSSNYVVWSGNDMLLLSYYLTSDSAHFYLVSHYSA